MLTKLVAATISPLGTSLVLGLAALIIWVRAQSIALRRWAVRMGVVAVGWLGLWSTPFASDALRGWIEAHAGPRTIAALPKAAVIVVLGGGVRGPRLPLRPDPDLTSSADRVWYAARLYHAGKAPRLLLSGGTVGTGDTSEAESMQRLLVDLGVPPHAMMLEATSTSTASNAAMAKRLLAAEGIDEVILVTSAMHMPRARKLFENAGLNVIAAPTDFEVVEMPFDLMRVVPDAGALDGSARAFKELAGWWVAR